MKTVDKPVEGPVWNPPVAGIWPRSGPQHFTPYRPAEGNSWYYIIPHWQRTDVDNRIGPFHSAEDAQGDIDGLIALNREH